MEMTLTSEQAREADLIARVAVSKAFLSLPKEMSRILGYQTRVRLEDRNLDGINELYVDRARDYK